jgi:NmrA-like family protein
MTNADKTVLVTGATGRQGGAVIRHMLPKGWKLRALTRKTDGAESSSPGPEAGKVQRLKDHGIEVVKGDMEDSASLERALRGTYGVYSVQNFWSVGAKVKSSRARTWRRQPRRPRWNTSSTVPWAGQSGTRASIIGRASGRLRSIFARSACQLQCSGRLRSWRTTTSIRLKSEF